MEALSTRLRLRVSPGSTRGGVVGRHGDAWKVRVAGPAEGGRANDAGVRLLADAPALPRAAVVRLLAEPLALPRDAVTLLSGHGARDKIVRLTGLGPSQIEQRLTAAA